MSLDQNRHDSAPDKAEVPSKLDQGLAFAYGEGSVESTSPSEIERIGEITG